MKRLFPILLLLVLAALTVVGLRRISLNVDVLDLLPKDMVEAQGLRVFREHFRDDNELILTVRTDSVDRSAAIADSLGTRLRGVEGLAERVDWEPAWAEDPLQLAEILAYMWFNGEPAGLGKLEDRLKPGASVEWIETRFEDVAFGMVGEGMLATGYDPLGLGELPDGSGGVRERGRDDAQYANADGTLRLLFVRPTVEVRGFHDAARWMPSLHEAVEDWKAITGDEFGEFELGITGGPAVLGEMGVAMQRDMLWSVASTLMGIAVLFWIFHRSMRPLLLIVAMVFLIIGATLGIGGLIYGALSAMSMGFAAILIGLAVDYGLVVYQEARGGRRGFRERARAGSGRGFCGRR